MGMAPLNGSIYIFAGMDLGTGPDDDGPLTAYNDFWRGSPLSPLPPEGTFAQPSFRRKPESRGRWASLDCVEAEE